MKHDRLKVKTFLKTRFFAQKWRSNIKMINFLAIVNLLLLSPEFTNYWINIFPPLRESTTLEPGLQTSLQRL